MWRGCGVTGVATGVGVAAGTVSGSLSEITVLTRAGLLVMPGAAGRDGQQQLACTAIHYIVSVADEAADAPADFMVNKLVEIVADGSQRARPPCRVAATVAHRD